MYPRRISIKPIQRRKSVYARGARNCMGNILSIRISFRPHLYSSVSCVPLLYMKTFVILHNIRSAFNVGSIFRTGDGAGVTKIYLTGYTPTPTDRFGRPHSEILKTSLGAVQTVPYEVIPDVQELILNLKKEGICIVAVEQTKRASNYKNYILKKDTAFIFGNEITGIEEELLNSVDEQILVPMYGAKESLNVSVCAGIILFHFRR